MVECGVDGEDEYSRWDRIMSMDDNEREEMFHGILCGGFMR